MAEKTRNGRVVKYKKRRNVNIGLLIFAAIFIYFTIYIVMFMTRDRISIYEVSYGKTAESTNKYYEGLILRDETVYNAPSSGYLNCFVRESNKVRVGSTVYTIDKNGSVLSMLEESLSDNSTLTSENYAQIKDMISAYTLNYSNNTFDAVYDFKTDIDSALLECVNINKINEIISSMSDSDLLLYNMIKADKSGIISYNIDGYEDKSATSLKLIDFKKENYSFNAHKTNDLIAEGTPVYRSINSEKWQIVIPLSDEDAKKYYEDTVAKIRFKNDGITAVGDFELIYIESKPFAIISLDQYMIRYASDRFVDIQIVEDQVEGLKIPKTALVNMDFYTIPARFATYGGNTKEVGFICERYDENGAKHVEYINPEIYEFIDGIYYVGTDKVNNGDVLVLEDMSENYVIGPKASLTGVYNINNGYCIFREVNILAESSEYYIIESGTTYGLLVYDHIVLDSNTVTENQVVYH